MKKFSFFRMIGLGQIVCLALTISFTGCQKSDKEDPNETSAINDQDEIATQLLAEVNYEDGSSVQIYELEPGDIAIRHTQPMIGESGNGVSQISRETGKKLDLFFSGNSSLPEIYKSITSNPKVKDLTALADADVRLKSAQAEVNTGETDDSSLESPADANEYYTIITKSTTACTPDYYNDNYGRNWFVDNYVNDVSNYGSRKTELNYEGFYLTAHIQDLSKVRISMMNADFEASSWFGVYQRKCPFLSSCRWDLYDSQIYILESRNVEVWLIKSKKSIKVDLGNDNECGMVHLGVNTNGSISISKVNWPD